MRALSFILGTICGIGIITLQPTAAAPSPEIQTVVEIKTLIQKEYIKVNQTEPMNMTTTAYTAGPESTGKKPGGKGYGITFTGTKAKVGVCAVDPNYVPLGSSLYVEGYGYCRAEDKGSAVKGYHVDVFMDGVNEALRFGNEQRKVWILNDFEDGEDRAKNDS